MAKKDTQMSLKGAVGSDSSKDKKTRKKKENTSSIDATKVVKDYSAAWDYTNTSLHSKWADAYKVYKNMRVKYGYNGVSDSFVPETRTIIESLISNIAGGKPRFQFVATDEEQESKTDALNELMDYFWECNHMDLKAQQWVKDMLLYGTGVLHVSWDAKRERPDIRNIPLRDFFVNPEATCIDDARYMGFRYLANINDLKSMKVYDLDEDKMVPKYKNLGDLGTSTGSGDQLDKEVKDELMGSTLGKNANKEQVEVILIYYRQEKRVVEVANRTTVIRNVETPYQRAEKTVEVEAVVDGEIRVTEKKIPAIEPFFPFAVLRDYIDTSLFYGSGEIEIILDRQEQLNDLENQDMDNLSYINNVMFQIDPQFAHMAPEIESIPGAVYPIPKNALTPIERPQINVDIDAKKQEIKDEMRRATAADEVIQGASQEQGRITATEVSAQINQANQRFSTKIANLESEGYADLASILFKITQIFVTETIAVRVLGDDGVEFKDYDPNEYGGDYEPHVLLDSTVKKQELEEGLKLNQLYQVILGNPVANQKEALRFIMKKLGAEDDEITKILTPDPMSMMPGMGMPGMVPGQPGAEGQPMPPTEATPMGSPPVDGGGMPVMGTSPDAQAIAAQLPPEQ